MTKRSVVDVAGAVARGELSAAAVLEDNLKAIAARESEVHAFNLVTADAARERAAQHANGGRLASAVRPDQSEQFAAPDVERKMIDRRIATERFG